jgi:hypothetical protein
MADGRTQHPGRVKHAFGVPDGDGVAVVVVLEFFDLQDFAHRLRNAQVARRQQHHEAVARFFIDDHLAKGADLVQTGVGAGVGQENQSGIEFDGDAVGHGESVNG